ncbi:hypothetical protein GCM10028832_03910 [Streptomyces sparsus]
MIAVPAAKSLIVLPPSGISSAAAYPEPPMPRWAAAGTLTAAPPVSCTVVPVTWETVPTVTGVPALPASAALIGPASRGRDRHVSLSFLAVMVRSQRPGASPSLTLMV